MGKTFLSLFRSFNRDELCQFYVYPTLPDVDICHSYYRITDRNVFDSYWHFGRVKGKEVTAKDIDTSKHLFFENEKEERFINVKKTVLKTILRDAMWMCSRWYNRPLKHWIEKERPSCIFFAPGEAIFLYNIALRITKDYGIPIITYICDEYYFVKNSEKLLARIRLKALRMKIRKIMNKTKCVVAISDEIKRIYSKEFNVSAYTIMTGSSIPVSSLRKNKKVPIGITYIGNLEHDRISSVVEVGKALDEVNNILNKNIKLLLYTRTLNDNQKKMIGSTKSIEYCGYVTGEDYTHVLLDADALLHIESFEEKYIDEVKNSISTKIADSLCSGNPLIAYAPEKIASMKYLKSEGAAFTITNPKELVSRLYEFFSNEELRKTIAQRGIESAKKNHIAQDNSRRIMDICELYSL